MSKLQELKKITAEKKALAERQKALRAELSKNKESRKNSRSVQAQSRRDVQIQNKKLRDLQATVYKTFSSGDLDAIDTLADKLIEAGTALATTVRNFADASRKAEGNPIESEEAVTCDSEESADFSEYEEL